MPSPFPGMDPYLEDPTIWSDFHLTFLVAIRAELNPKLPSGYAARIDRHVWIDDPDADSVKLLGRPDIYLTENLALRPVTGSSVVMAAPATATLPAIDAKGKPFLKIIDVADRRVVTVLELLSPANKTKGKDQDAYLAKRLEYFRSHVNVVELDLLRGGQRPPVEGPLPKADYFILVSPAEDYPSAGVWPFDVRDRFPTFQVPLDPGVESVELNLRPALDRAFLEARFEDELRYQEPLNPPLAENDAAWAEELLAGWSKQRN